MNDRNRFPLSVTNAAKRAIPTGKDMRSKPINLSIVCRTVSHVNIKSISTSACDTRVSRPAVLINIGHTARYNVGSQLAKMLNGLNRNGSRKSSMVHRLYLVSWLTLLRLMPNK